MRAHALNGGEAPRAPLDARAGRVGPNAIIQMRDALRASTARAATAGIFESAGLARYLARDPDSMVPEGEVAALMRAVHATLSPQDHAAVCAAAGARIGDYLVANRIPGAVCALLKRLPAALALPLLDAAIRRHAWTFSGSGTFGVRREPHRALVITDCPLCRGLISATPACTLYAATFERLYRVLVHPDIRVIETECCAFGAPACVFALQWEHAGARQG